MKKLSTLIIVFILGLITTSPIYAAQNPTVTVHEVYAFNSIIEPDDLYILVRYDLPHTITDGVSDAWCSELEYQEGCTDTPSVPLQPASLPVGKVSAQYLENSIIQFDNPAIPRISNGLLGLYASSGHGLTWNSTNSQVCLQPASSYSPVVNSCKNVSFVGGKEYLKLVLMNPNGIIYNLEKSYGFKRYTFNYPTGEISPAGEVFVKESFPAITKILPEIFSVTSKSSLSDQTLTSTPVTQNQLTLDAETSGLTAALDGSAQYTFGTSGQTMGLIFIGFMSIFLGFLTFRTTFNGALTSIAVMIPILWGVFMSIIPLAVVFTVLALLSFPLAWFIVRKSGAS